MKTIHKLFTIAAAAMLTACASQDPIASLVDELYDRMTPEERVAQLHSMYMADLFGEDGRLDPVKCENLIPNGVGHFSQYADNEKMSPDDLRDKVAQVQEWLMNNTPSGIPALFHEELLTGVCSYEATVYPQQIGLASSFNPELAELKTYQTAADARSIGCLLALSPMVDVCRNPHFNRLEESYGEDAYLSAAMGTAFVRGLQHGDLREGVAACSKHFLGYGGGGDAPEKELMEEILMPHETMIRLAGSKVVMTGYHQVNGINAVASSYLQEDILRNYLGFDGMMVSDYTAIDQNRAEPDKLHKAAAALNAGNDVEFPRGTNYIYLPQAIQEGLVSEADFEAAVKHVLTMKARLGMFDKNPYLYAEGHIEFDDAERRQTAYTLATQSVVLLKNDGVLPLSKPGAIALTGPNANTMWAMLGDYTYNSMRWFWMRQIHDELHPRIYSLKDGLESRLPEGSTLAYSRGCDWTEKVETLFNDFGDDRARRNALQNRMVDSGETANEAEALRMAEKSDVIIAAVGENVILCGENRDRTTLRLPGRQEEFVEKLIATGKPVVLIVFGGRAQVISGLAEKCAAVIQAWYPGEEGGNALADILYGNVSPSGKLSVSYPAVELDEPISYTYTEKQDPRIAYPFGYGLSYTSFEYSNLSIGSGKTDSEGILVSFDVTNTGSVAADEIAQIYVSPSSAGQNLPARRLQGFGRIHLEPGETHSFSFMMSPEQFGYYTDWQWQIDPGKFIVKVGASSEDIRLSGELSLGGRSVVKKLRSTYFAKEI